MARKKSKTQPAAPAASPDTQLPRYAETGPALRSDERSRFVLYNLLGKERSYYDVRRFDLARPAGPVAEKAVAHSIVVIDRSGSMSGWIEELKDTLIKLLTLEEYRNFDLLVTLISYSGQGDVVTHFQRAPISEIMKRDSKQVKAIREIRATGLTCISQALQLASDLVDPNELTGVTLHSDGYANDPSANSETRTIEGLCDSWQERDLFVNTIAYSDYSDFRLLSRIANTVSGTCIKTGKIKEVYDSLYATSKLLGGAVSPPIEEPLAPEYDFQVFLSHAANRLNGAAGPLHVRGLKPEDDAIVYKYRKLSRAEFDKLADVRLVQNNEAVLAFARANLAEGNLNTAKYAMASFFDKTLFDRHSRALTNNEVAALAMELDLLLFQPGLLGEHEMVDEVPVNRRISLLQLMRLLEQHKDSFDVNFVHLRDTYVRRGIRRIPGERLPDGSVLEPWLKTEFLDAGDYVRISSVDVNRNTANLNILVPRPVKLVTADKGKEIRTVAGVELDKLTSYNNYTVVGDGELNVRTLRVRISDRALFDRLVKERVLEYDGMPAKEYDAGLDYTIRLDVLPLVPPFEAKVDLNGVFRRLAELKILSSICKAHLREESDVFTAEQLEDLKKHYLSKNLYLNFPTTNEYANLEEALNEGVVDARTSYKIDVGDHQIINLGKLHSANKCLERLYEVLNSSNQRIDKPKFEDCLEGVSYRRKALSARTRITPVDELMRTYFDDFLGVAPNGAAVRALSSVGADELAKIAEARARGQQPAKAAFVAALTSAERKLNRAADELYEERVSPLVFYVGATGVLPDEIESKALTAEQLTTKYPALLLSSDEQDGLFFEVGEAILSVYAKREYFTRDATVTGGGQQAAPAPM